MAVLQSNLSKVESLEEKIARLEAENASLRSNNKIYFKVSGKGAVSLYGLQKFPVTLYKTQWEQILDMAPEIKSFLEANEASLTTK